MKQQIEHFKVVYHIDKEDFENVINKLINEGYEPYGNLSFSSNNDREYVQAMIKFKNPEEELLNKIKGCSSNLTAKSYLDDIKGR